MWMGGQMWVGGWVSRLMSLELAGKPTVRPSDCDRDFHRPPLFPQTNDYPAPSQHINKIRELGNLSG